MAKQEKTLGLGEISTIRDILMGQQINEYQEKFNELDEKTDALDKSMSDRLTQLEKNIDARLTEMEKTFAEKMDKLEGLMTNNVQQLDEKVSSSSSHDKHLIGQLLQDMSKQLLNGNGK